MRSHSVSAEGGTAAVLFPDEGDSIESHIYDTVKGSDFLADQDAAERLCKEMPDEIYQLEHWGMPWSRREDGKLGQRAFGGYSFPRATYASDKVGFLDRKSTRLNSSHALISYAVFCLKKKKQKNKQNKLNKQTKQR